MQLVQKCKNKSSSAEDWTCSGACKNKSSSAEAWTCIGAVARHKFYQPSAKMVTAQTPTTSTFWLNFVFAACGYKLPPILIPNS